MQIRGIRRYESEHVHGGQVVMTLTPAEATSLAEILHRAFDIIDVVDRAFTDTAFDLREARTRSIGLPSGKP